jgi:hypothetical protein
VVTLLLNERAIRGHIVESLEDRLERDLILLSEFFGTPRIRTMDDLVDHRRADSSILEEELTVIRAGTRLEVLILFFGLGEETETGTRLVPEILGTDVTVNRVRLSGNRRFSASS